MRGSRASSSVMPATQCPAAVSTHPVTLAADSLLALSISSLGPDATNRIANVANGKCLQAPVGICVDREGAFYVADSGNCRILKILPDNVGTAIILAGGGGYGFLDGAGALSRFTCPMYLAHDGFEALYVTDQHSIRRVACPSGDVTTLAGGPQPGHVDGPAASARFYNLRGIALDTDGNIFVADSSNHCIRMLSVDGTVSTLAGHANSGAMSAGYQDASVAHEAKFRHPCGVLVDLDGSVIVADAENNRLRKIDLETGAVTTIAGVGSAGHADEMAPQSRLNHPQGIAIDGDGNIIIADLDNHRIRMMTPHGVMTTLAGTGTAGERDHKAGLNAQFLDPHGVVVTPCGEVLVTEGSSNKVRVIKAGLQPPHHFVASAKSSFCDDMLALLASDEYADVSFNVCGHKFTAHQAILAARCEYFRRMLSSGLKEGTTQSVDILDTSPVAFGAFLKYLYTDHISLTGMSAGAISAAATSVADGCGSSRGPERGGEGQQQQVALDLMLLGRKYFVPRLFQQCCDHVRRNLTYGNALGLLVWAEDHSVEELRATLYRFVMQNVGTILTQHPDTLRLVQARSDLLVAMLKQTADKQAA